MKRLTAAILGLMTAVCATAAVPIRFEGCRSHTPDDLARSLSLNLEYALTEANASPLGLAPVVQRLLLAGYRNAGYADAEVSTDIDPAGVVVHIDEGIRYLCGELRITGKLAAAESTVLQVTLLAAADNAEVTNVAARLENWNATGGAPFTEAFHVQACRAVSNACVLRLGATPRFTVELAKRTADGRADLVVAFAEPPLKRTVGTIEIEGAVTNTAAEISAHLGLETGQPIGADRIAALNERLLQAGRFITSSVVVGSPAADGRCSVLVRVVEAPTVPPLREALSPAATALLRAATWLDEWKQGESEMELRLNLRTIGNELPPWEVNLIAAPRTGCALLVTNPHAAATGLLFSVHALVGSELSLFSSRAQRNFTVPAPDVSVVFQFEIGAYPPDADGRWRQLNTGLYFGSSNGAPIQIKTRLHPAAMVAMAYSTNTAPRLDDGIYSVTLGPGIVLRVEAATGRPVEFAADGKGAIRFTQGALDRAIAQTRSVPRGVSAYEATRPFASFLGFVGPELLHIPALETSLLARVSAGRRETFLQAGGTLIQSAAAVPWDRLFADLTGGTNRLFIPSDPARLPPSASGPLAFLAPYLLVNADRVAPGDSWPATALRAKANAICGLGKPFGAAMESIAKSPDSGPLALGLCASMTRTLSPRFSRQVAALIAERSTAADFRRDLEPLLDEKFLFGELLHRTAHTLAALKAEEAEALAEALPEPHRPAFVRFVEALRKAESGDFRRQLADALCTWWQDDLRALYLEELRDPASPAGSP